MLRTAAALITATAALSTFAAAAHADRVVTLSTGSPILDGHCREYAKDINFAFASNKPEEANAILRQARQKGCRYLLLPVISDTGSLVLSARSV